MLVLNKDYERMVDDVLFALTHEYDGPVNPVVIQSRAISMARNNVYPPVKVKPFGHESDPLEAALNIALDEEAYHAGCENHLSFS